MIREAESFYRLSSIDAKIYNEKTTATTTTTTDNNNNDKEKKNNNDENGNTSLDFEHTEQLVNFENERNIDMLSSKGISNETHGTTLSNIDLVSLTRKSFKISTDNVNEISTSTLSLNYKNEDMMMNEDGHSYEYSIPVQSCFWNITID